MNEPTQKITNLESLANNKTNMDHIRVIVTKQLLSRKFFLCQKTPFICLYSITKFRASRTKLQLTLPEKHFILRIQMSKFSVCSIHWITRHSSWAFYLIKKYLLQFPCKIVYVRWCRVNYHSWNVWLGSKNISVSIFLVNFCVCRK